MLTSASIKYLIPTDFICDITDKFIFSGVQVKDAADNGVEYLLKKHPELVKFQLGERRMFLGEQGEEAIYFTIAGLNTLLSMPGLTSLSIISRIDINPANVTKIMSKQLQTLDLSGIKDIDDAFFLHIVEQCGKTLKFLNLSYSQISGDKLVDCNGALHCLDTLELQKCSRLTVTGLYQIFKSCGKTLRSLNLSESGIFVEFFRSYVEYSGTLACLEELGLSECEKITDEGLLQIFKVCGTTLRSLYLDSTYVTGESLVEYSGTLACLENLNGIYTQINDTGLLQIFKVCGTTLRSLDLRNTYITGESLVEFSGTLACLENLDLSNCVRITDEGLLQIFKVCGTSLRSLNLGSTHVTGESLVEYSGILACLKNLNGRSSRITDRGLLQIFKVCGTTLRSLDLSNTDITGESLVEYSGTLPCLEKLNLQSCKITDRGLVKILQHFGKTLRYLYLDRKCQKEENLLKYKKMGLLLDSVTVS